MPNNTSTTKFWGSFAKRPVVYVKRLCAWCKLILLGFKASLNHRIETQEVQIFMNVTLSLLYVLEMKVFWIIFREGWRSIVFW